MPKGVYPREGRPQWKPFPCATCGKMVMPTGSAQKYCPICRATHKRQQAREATKRLRAKGLWQDKCPKCGEQKMKVAAFCKSCRQQLNSERAREVGRLTSSGYRDVTLNGRRVAQHRLVVEERMGRLLRKDEIVHHLNGVRTDNRPENLVITRLGRHQYQTLLKLAQSRIRTLEQLHFNLDTPGQIGKLRDK